MRSPSEASRPSELVFDRLISFLEHQPLRNSLEEWHPCPRLGVSVPLLVAAVACPLATGEEHLVVAVDQLLKAGVSPHATDSARRSALWWAVHVGRLAVAARLVEAGSTLRVQTYRAGGSTWPLSRGRILALPFPGTSGSRVGAMQPLPGPTSLLLLGPGQGRPTSINSPTPSYLSPPPDHEALDAVLNSPWTTSTSGAELTFGSGSHVPGTAASTSGGSGSGSGSSGNQESDAAALVPDLGDIQLRLEFVLRHLHPLALTAHSLPHFRWGGRGCSASEYVATKVLEKADLAEKLARSAATEAEHREAAAFASWVSALVPAAAVLLQVSGR